MDGGTTPRARSAPAVPEVPATTPRRVGGLPDAVLLSLVCFCGTAAVGYGTIRSFDGSVMYAVTRAIAHGRLHLVSGQPPFQVRHTNPSFLVQFPYSHYGIGQSLAMLPLYLLARPLGLPAGEAVTLANPVITALTAVLLQRLGLALGWSRRLALGIALALVFLTLLFQDTTEAFSEPGVSLGVVLLLLGLVRLRAGRRASGLLMGTGLGLAILFRTDSVLLVGVVVLLVPFLLPRARWRTAARTQLAGFLLPLIPVAMWTAYYSHLSSGALFPRAYGGSFTAPFWTGFYGQVIGPNKGFFVFDPWLLLALPGLVLIARRDRVWALLLLTLWLLRAVFYARWSYWYGGVAWGPRFLVPGIVPLAVAAGEAVRALPLVGGARLRSTARVVVVVLLATSAVVSLASVWVSYAQSYQLAFRSTVGLSAAAAHRAGLDGVHRHLHVASSSQLWLALTHLSHAAPFGLYHFRGGPSAAGVILVLVSVSGLILLVRRTSTRGNNGPAVRARTAPRHTPLP